MWQIWLIIAGFFIIFEIATVGFLVFWFSIGAVIAAIFSLFIDNIIFQTAIFLISSTILLFATRPFANKMLQSTKQIKTNAFSIEGKIGKVIKDIDPTESTGQIKVNGEVWSAKSHNSTFIPKDTEVTIESIDGVKVIVIPLK